MHSRLDNIIFTKTLYETDINPYVNCFHWPIPGNRDLRFFILISNQLYPTCSLFFMIMTSLEISGNHTNAMQNLTKLVLSLIQRSLNAENSKLHSMKVSYN